MVLPSFREYLLAKIYSDYNVVIIGSLIGLYGKRYYNTGYFDRDASDRERKRQHDILCKECNGDR